MKKFNKDKYLKVLRFKKYKRYLYIGIPCLLVLLIGIYFAYSKFSVSKEEEVVRTTVGDFISGDAVIGAYVDGEYSKSIPGKNDGYIVDKIVCDNDVSASWDNDSWGIVLTNLTKKTKCNIYFETKKPSLTEAITTAMNNNPSMFATDDADNNVRYIGKDPSNYVYFNCSDYNNPTADTCEKWRIIGVFNNVTKGDGSKENLVKIIRADSLGYYAWSKEYDDFKYGKGDWPTSALNYLLNSGYDNESIGGSLYWNAKSGRCWIDDYRIEYCDFASSGLKNDITRNIIENVVWNLGGMHEYCTPSEFYVKERGTRVASGHATTWTGKIGLMYLSDYGYATIGSSGVSRTTCLEKKMSDWPNDCYNNNYLKDVGMTLSPSTGDETLTSNCGGIPCPIPATESSSIYPTLYLKSNIKIKTGTGNEQDPYQLKIS